MGIFVSKDAQRRAISRALKPTQRYALASAKGAARSSVPLLLWYSDMSPWRREL